MGGPAERSSRSRLAALFATFFNFRSFFNRTKLNNFFCVRNSFYYFSKRSALSVLLRADKPYLDLFKEAEDDFFFYNRLLSQSVSYVKYLLYYYDAWYAMYARAANKNIDNAFAAFTLPKYLYFIYKAHAKRFATKVLSSFSKFFGNFFSKRKVLELTLKKIIFLKRFKFNFFGTNIFFFFNFFSTFCKSFLALFLPLSLRQTYLKGKSVKIMSPGKAISSWKDAVKFFIKTFFNKRNRDQNFFIYCIIDEFFKIFNSDSSTVKKKDEFYDKILESRTLFKR